MTGGEEDSLAFRFPDRFLWGAATAAHHVEGNNTNSDWWEWEQLPGKIKDGSRSGAACEHYSRYRADFEMLHDMGHNAHRLSIEWSRVAPSPGVIDSVAVAHYRDVLTTLVGLGMEPLVTLHHFTNPTWFSRMGGFAADSSVDHFRDFARLCAREFGDLVRLWTTFNEPNVYWYYGYVIGEWPPEKRDLGLGMRVWRNMLRAHAAAYGEIKSAPHGSASQVGVAQHLRVFAPGNPWSPLDRVVASVPRVTFNHWFLRGCETGFAGFPLGLAERVPQAAGTLDWIGVNYYSRDMVAFKLDAPRAVFSRNFVMPGAELSDYRMEVYPEGLHTVLRDTWERYRKPLYITENGVADATDSLRPRALVGHLAEAARALRDGVDLRGYMHWSTMDNFEWAEGYAMRFGLIHVDFETQARTARPSAALYSRIIARNGLSWAQVQQYYPKAMSYFVAASST
ncbi:MAG: glycoside hydrolase family 1 protein [Candidatus Dormibacteria bacterium]